MMAARHPAGACSRRNGFTLVEVLMVVIVIGILSGLAVPIYRDVTVRADAARIVSDVHTIQLAVADYLVDEKVHPATAAIGVMPRELEDRLPDNFPFAWGAVKYRYRRWAIPGTARWERRSARGLPVVGVEIYSSSEVLLRHLEALSQGRGQMLVAGSITLILE